MTDKPFSNAKAACLWMARFLGLTIDSQAEYGGHLFLTDGRGQMVQQVRGYDQLERHLRERYKARFDRDAPTVKGR